MSLTRIPQNMLLGGNVNYIAANCDAEENTTGWATYADAAGNVPVDGLGGSATNLTFSRSTSAPLRGSASFSIAQANSSSLQGKGVSYDFAISTTDQAKVLSISFDYNASTTFLAADATTAPLNDGTTTTNAGNSDVEVFIYDVTNAVLTPVSPQTITANGANNAIFKGIFQTASNSTSYRLILHVATASANATGWTLKYDNVYVGPQNIASSGSPITDWAAYTPTFTGFGTPTGVSFFSRRVGDSLEVHGYFTAGTTTATQAQITLGYNGGSANVTIDTTKILTGTLIGTFAVGRNSATEFNWSPLASGANNYFTIGEQASTLTSLSAANGNTLGSSGNVMSVYLRVPVLGFSSNTIMSSDSNNRIVAFQSLGTPAVAPTTGNPFIFPTVGIDTHGCYNTVTGEYRVPVSGLYQINALISIAAVSIEFFVYKNGVSERKICQSSASANHAVAGSTLVKCLAGDLLTIVTGGNTTTMNPHTFISIQLISGPATIAASETVSTRWATSSSTITASLGKITFLAKSYDSHNAMSGGSTFTCPTAGKYSVDTNILIGGTWYLNAVMEVHIYKNGVTVKRNLTSAAGATSYVGGYISDVVSCVAGDTLEIWAVATNTSPVIVGDTNCHVAIVRVGN